MLALAVLAVSGRSGDARADVGGPTTVAVLRPRKAPRLSIDEPRSSLHLEDRILVTSNVADFVKLARARDLHAGIGHRAWSNAKS